MKLFTIFITATILFSTTVTIHALPAALRIAARAEQDKKDNKNTDKTANEAAEQAVIDLNASNIIVLANSKDVDKLVQAMRQKPVAAKSEPQPAQEKRDMWIDMKQELRKLYEKVNEMRIFTMENLYFLIGGLMLTFIIVHLLRWISDHIIVKHFTSKTKSDLDDRIVAAINPPITLAIYSIGIYLSSMRIIMRLPDEVFNICGKLSLAALAASVAWVAYRLIEIFTSALEKYASSTEGKLDDLLVILFRKSLKIGVVVISIVLIGQNILGLNITALLAGAGIFGLAIAFAAQDTIANFFGSIMIVLDRPFMVGDRIKVGDVNGVVKSVGFRSIKMETLDGHMITMPNKKITESSIENIAKRPFIKFTLNITVTYGTTPEKMRQAMSILHEIFDNHEGMNPERTPKIFFDKFNDWALNILTVLWYHPADWAMANEWMTRKNLEILQRFNDAGIDFAFPSNTTYLVNGNENLQISLNPGVKS